MKKTVKIVIITIIVIVITLVATPFLFQDKLVAVIKETINNNINAEVEFADASLSFLKSFPKASIELRDVLITNFKPFEGDTLAYSERIQIKLKLTEVFKNTNEGLYINSFIIDNSLINVKVDEKGNTNYDITKKYTEQKTKNEKPEENSNNFSLSLNSYTISNATIQYNNAQEKMNLVLSDFNHFGNGDFSQKKTMLDTRTTTSILFEKGENTLVKNQYLDLNALLALDLENNKYSFLKNEAHINQLPLTFDGYVQLKKDNSQEIHINFKTLSSDFKNFLALIPRQYTKSFSDVKTTGNFSVSGKIDGKVTEKTIPNIDIVISSANASFKYPGLPKSVENIRIQTQIKNTTGNTNDTYIDIQKLAFKIDHNKFSGNAKISNLSENPYIHSTINGKIDLSDIGKAYPLKLKNNLRGTITTHLTSSFDIDAIQNSIYQRIKNNGSLEVNDFLFQGKDIANPIQIHNAKVDFKPAKIILTKFDAVTGTSDLKATGTITNLLGFLLSYKNLQGTFNLNSNSFKINDFMVADINSDSSEREEKTTDKKEIREQLKIPAFLDCTVNVSAKEVFYDNFKLSNINGTLIIKDKKAILKDVNGNMFGGNIALNGAVNTQKEQALFDMNMGIQSFNITDSFKNIKLFNMLSPVANVLQGQINTNLNVSGNLNHDYVPNLTSATGKVLAEVLVTNIAPENSKVLNLLDQSLGFIDLKGLDLKNIKTNFSFENGKVYVKPFNLKYKDIDIQITGNHSFDQLMDYNAVFNVPARYLGSEVTNLLTNIDSKNITVPVTANFSGTFTNPSVRTDFKYAVNNLTTQLVKKQKENLINKAVVGGLLKGKKKKYSKKDTIKSNTVNKVKDVLGDLFGKKKKKE